MFWRIYKRLVWAGRRRLGLALLAVTSSAAVCAALVNLDLDSTSKLTREFRALGANIILAPDRAAGEGATIEEGVAERVLALGAPEIVGVAPYLYVAAQAGEGASQAPVIVAGGWADQAALVNSWWEVEGERVVSREDVERCMVGRAAARSLNVAPSSRLILQQDGRELSCVVAGVVTAGGSEDSQVFVSLAQAERLAGRERRISLVQVSVRGEGSTIEATARRLAGMFPGVEVRPVRQLAAAEGRLMGRIRGLLFGTVLLILALSTLSVLAATGGLALQRRRDVGLMKALGGPVKRILRLFLAEAATVGIVGGIAGSLAGVFLAQWIGQSVFGAPVTARLIVVPGTVAATIVVALAGAMPLRLLGRVRPADILRNE
jgi:putative ABC transport system permease protein